MSTDDPLAATVQSDSDGPTAPASPSSSPAPEMIGRFSVGRKLGEGGMGVVWLATDPDLGRDIAIKVLRGEGADPSRRDRFMREARATACLVHDNIIVVHEVGMHDDRVYVAMEHVAGRTLGQWQRSQGWEAIVAAYVRAGRGLAAAHAAGLVHRDFKPDNVLIGDDGRLRVTDFGLVAATGTAASSSSEHARIATEEAVTHTGSILGTPRYMAPEQHDGAAVDARADQFAFCVALYEALFERPPYPGSTYADIVESVRAGTITPIPATSPVPAPIQRAILRGLARDREQRHDSMADLLRELARSAPAPTPRRRWWIAAAALLVAIAVVAIVVGYQMYQRSERDRAETKAMAAAAAEARARAEALGRENIELKSKLEEPKPRSHDPSSPPTPAALKLAQTNFEAAQEAYLAQRYDDAITKFLAAYAARPYPQFLYNAAAAYHMKAKQTNRKTDYESAIAQYKRYLVEDPDTSDRAKTERTIAGLEELVARR